MYKEVLPMFCVDCGTRVNEGELICKGCGKLSDTMRAELLALSEKTNAEASGKKCQSCGADIGGEHHFCHSCGTEACS